MDIQISEANLFLATSKITDEETARQIVSSVKGLIAFELKAANSNLSTKEDLYAVKEDIQKVKGELKEDIEKVKTELYNVKGELKEDIQNVKTELYKVKSELKEDLFKVKEDIFQVESRLSTKIYIVGLVQFLAIAGTVISVIAYMLQIK